MRKNYPEDEYTKESPLYEIEDDNIYSLDDNDEDSEGEEEDLAEDDEEELTEDPGAESRGKKSVFGLLLKIMTTPVEGWKELKRRKLKPEAVASGCFYPLTALAAVSEFSNLFYNDMELSDAVMRAMISFITFFFGYFTVLLFSAYLLPKSEREKMKLDIGKEFVMMNMSTMAIFLTVYNLLPMIGPVLVFLPLWTIYLICKGVKIFRVEKDYETRVKGMLCIMIIGCPLLWQWLLEELL